MNAYEIDRQINISSRFIYGEWKEFHCISCIGVSSGYIRYFILTCSFAHSLHLKDLAVGCSGSETITIPRTHTRGVFLDHIIQKVCIPRVPLPPYPTDMTGCWVDNFPSLVSLLSFVPFVAIQSVGMQTSLVSSGSLCFKAKFCILLWNSFQENIDILRNISVVTVCLRGIFK